MGQQPMTIPSNHGPIEALSEKERIEQDVHCLQIWGDQGYRLLKEANDELLSLKSQCCDVCEFYERDSESANSNKGEHDCSFLEGLRGGASKKEALAYAYDHESYAAGFLIVDPKRFHCAHFKRVEEDENGIG
jgi:hypothetical protein